MANNTGRGIFLDGAGFNAGDGGIQYPPTLHSYWKCDEASGKLINIKAGSSFDLTENGTVPSDTGKIAGARGTFSSANYFNYPDATGTSIYDTNLFLIEYWFNISSAGARADLVSKEGAAGTTGWYAGTSTTNKAYFWWNNANPDINSSLSVTDGLWHYYLAGIRANSGVQEVRMYVDSSLANGGSQTGAAWTKAAVDLVVGKRTGTSSNPFGGKIDELAYHAITGVAPSWADIETNIVIPRWNGGAGRSYTNDS